MGISQYSVVIANLDPTIGSEIKKTRPCVVVSPIELNRNLNTIIVVPITSSFKKFPTRVTIDFEGRTGKMAVDQIRTIDAKRITKILGKITDIELAALKHTLRETLVD